FWQAIRMMRFGIALIELANGIAGTSPGDTGRRGHWCAGILSCDDLRSAPPAPHFAPSRFPTAAGVPLPLPPLVGAAGAVDTADAKAFRDALCAVLDGPQPRPPTLPPPLSIPDLGECRLELQQGLDPEVTVHRRFTTRIILDPSVT